MTERHEAPVGLAARDPIEAVVAGHVCLDLIPTIEAGEIAFTPGRLVEVGPAVVGTGGVVSNAGLALHRLGVKTRLRGKVGDDLLGRAIRTIVSGFAPGLDEGMREAAGEATSYTVIVSPRGADRMFLHCPGCNDTFGADDVDYTEVAAARIFHFGYPPVMRRLVERGGAELAALLARARETGVTTSLDMTMPDPNGFSGRVDWRSVLAKVLPFVDFYTPSLDETLWMLRGEVPADDDDENIGPKLLDEIAGELLALGPAAVGLKLGPLGFYLRTAGRAVWQGRERRAPRRLEPWFDRQLWSPCFQVSVAGTTGAGDATIAGFLAALLREHGPEECVTMACAVGACSVEAPDALSGVRGWDETRARMQAGWARRPLPLAETEWRRDPATGAWRGPADSCHDDGR